MRFTERLPMFLLNIGSPPKNHRGWGLIVRVFLCLGQGFLVSGLLASPLGQPPSPAALHHSINADRPPRHVILIIVDTLRPDFLSCYNPHSPPTPHIDQLAREGLQFTKAMSPAPWTLPAVASIMSGLSPFVHLAVGLEPTLPDAVPTLAEYLRDARYHTAAIGYNSFLLPEYNMGQGFIEYNFFPHSSDQPRLFRADNSTSGLTDLASRWLNEHYSQDFFFWLHYFDPHRPYAPPENLLPAVEPPPFIGTAFTEFRKIRGGYFFPSLAEMEWIKTLYDAEVRHVDDNIGRLIDLLKQLGIYNESLIILTSDHGEEFWEHGGYEHGHTLYNELLWVPLIIKLPGSTTTGQIHSLVDITSITPTILEACHIEYDANYLSVPSLSACWDPRRQAAPGRPLVSTGLLYYEDRESVRLGAYKYIRSLVRGREELYNLDDDPAEWFSIVRSSPEKVGQAKKILNEERARAQYLREHYGIVSSEGAILDEETLEKLRSLGYID